MEGGDSVRRLAGFERVHLKAGETKELRFSLTPVPGAKTKISVGGGQPVSGVSRAELVL
jgi:beta-glucosidase